MKSYPITPLSMRQVKDLMGEIVVSVQWDHVCPGLARRVPAISALLGALFQERGQQFYNLHAAAAEHNDY